MFAARDEDCLRACQDCAAACERCAVACLEEARRESARCAALALDCAAACQLTAGFEARGSAYAAAAREFCERLCSACAGECERHESAHCRECAAACRACAEACRAAGSAQQAPGDAASRGWEMVSA